MPKFKVTVTKDTGEEVEIGIDAANEAGALIAAVERFEPGDAIETEYFYAAEEVTS